MNSKTHVAAGIATSCLLYGDKLNINPISAIGAGIVGALLPDIDLYKIGTKPIGKSHKCAIMTSLTIFLYNKSYISMVIFISVTIIGLLNPHRSILHSILGCILYSSPVALGAPELLPFFIAAYMSHLVLDSVTTRGIKWLYPYNNK